MESWPMYLPSHAAEQIEKHLLSVWKCLHVIEYTSIERGQQPSTIEPLYDFLCTFKITHIYIYTLNYWFICACVYSNINLYIFMCKYIWDLGKFIHLKIIEPPCNSLEYSEMSVLYQGNWQETIVSVKESSIYNSVTGGGGMFCV